MFKLCSFFGSFGQLAVLAVEFWCYIDRRIFMRVLGSIFQTFQTFDFNVSTVINYISFQDKKERDHQYKKAFSSCKQAVPATCHGSYQILNARDISNEFCRWLHIRRQS